MKVVAVSHIQGSSWAIAPASSIAWTTAASGSIPASTKEYVYSRASRMPGLLGSGTALARRGRDERCGRRSGRYMGKQRAGSPGAF